MVRNLLAVQETWVGKIPWRRAWQHPPVFLPGESPWTEEAGGLQRVRHDWVTKHSTIHQQNRWASQVTLAVKNPSANAGDKRDLGSIPGSGRSPGGRHVNPFWYFCLENPHGQMSPQLVYGLQSMGSQRVGHKWATKHTHMSSSRATQGSYLYTPCLHFLTCKMGII